MPRIIIPGQNDDEDDDIFLTGFSSPKELAKEDKTPPPSAKPIRLKATVDADNTGPLLSMLDIIKEHQQVRAGLKQLYDYLSTVDRQIIRDYIASKDSLSDQAKVYLDQAEEAMDLDPDDYLVD